MEKVPPYTAIHQHIPSSYQWRTGFFGRAPWIAIGALTLSTACAAAAAIIVIVSNNQQALWKLRPSVLLALLSSVATGLPVIALTFGVAITWWRTVLRPQGTTLSNLHHIWNHGHSTLGAVLSGKKVNRVSIATVFLTVASIAYSPLLQRSSFTQIIPLTSNVTMFMDIYDQLPSGIGGTVISDQEVFIGYTAYTAIQDWYSGYQMQTYEDPGYACNGTCLAYVPSPGIVGHDCEQERVEIDMATAAEDGTFVFAINFTRYDDTDGLPTLQMTTQGLSAVNENCVGTLVTNTCKMHAGTVDYPVLIDYINVVTNKNLSRRFIGEPYSYPGDLSTAPYGTPAGPLGALKWFGDAYFLSNATVRYNSSAGSYSANSEGLAAVQYFDTDGGDYVQNLNCAFLWRDPTEDIIQAFSEVLFRASFYAGLDADDDSLETQEFPAAQTVATLVYQSHYLYLIIGSAVLLLALLAVAATIWGWWELGRDMSLSPLEMAQAFGAQILAPESFENTNDLVAQIGKRRVRYGDVGVVHSDGIQRRVLRIQELGIGQDPMTPRAGNEGV